MARPLKIAVLLPVSNVHPLMGGNLWEGLRLWLAEHGGEMAGRTIELSHHPAPAEPARLRSAVQQVLNVERAEIVVALINPRQAEDLRDLFENPARLLFIPTVGANATLDSALSRSIFRNSLGYWQSNYAAGEWVGRHLGPRVMVAPIMLDAGFHSYFAFDAGLQSAGGKVALWRVADGKDFVMDTAPVIADARAARPNAVFGFGCGDKSVQLVRDYIRSGLAAEIPFLCTAFACEAPVLARLGAEGEGLRSVFSWADGLDLPGNKHFRAAYQERVGSPADAFAVLGYESAHFLNIAVEAAAGDMKQSDAWIAALETAEVDGPRGRVIMNPRVHSATGPLYLREVRGTGEAAGNQVLASLPPMPDGDPRFVSLLESGSLWYNEYLAV